MKDKVKFGPVVDEETGTRAVRRRVELDDGEVQEGAGLMMPLSPEEVAEGAAGVMLDPADSDGWREVRPLQKGPSRTSTPAYREGWDRIFGSREEEEGDDDELPPDKSMLN